MWHSSNAWRTTQGMKGTLPLGYKNAFLWPDHSHTIWINLCSMFPVSYPRIFWPIRAIVMQAMEYTKHTLTFRSNKAWPDLAEGRSSSSDWETNTLTVIPLPSHSKCHITISHYASHYAEMIRDGRMLYIYFIIKTSQRHQLPIRTLSFLTVTLENRPT